MFIFYHNSTFETKHATMRCVARILGALGVLREEKEREVLRDHKHTYPSPPERSSLASVTLRETFGPQSVFSSLGILSSSSFGLERPYFSREEGDVRSTKGFQVPRESK